MDKTVIRAFSRAAGTYDENSMPQQELWQELLNALTPFDINTKAVLDIGMGTGKNTYELTKIYPQSHIVGFDIAEGMVNYAKNNWIINQDRQIFLQADAEKIPFKDNTFDLVISNAVFQRIGNIKDVFSQINRILKPGGIFCLSLFLQETLFELKSAFVEAYKNIKGVNIPRQEEHNSDIKITEGLKSTVFNIIKKVEFKKKQYYKSPKDIIKWLKTIGATHHFRSWMNGINGRRVLQEMDRIYKERYSEDSSIYATFDGLIIKAQKI